MKKYLFTIIADQTILYYYKVTICQVNFFVNNVCLISWSHIDHLIGATLSIL